MPQGSNPVAASESQSRFQWEDRELRKDEIS